MAFVANGSVLPRASGASDLPMKDGAVPFSSPHAYQVSIDVPHRGVVTGMGADRLATGIVLLVFFVK